MRAATFLLFALILALAVSPALPEELGGLVGTKAPAFSAVDCRGIILDSEQSTKGERITVLNFWGLRCGACLEEIPHLNMLARKFGERVTVIGVNVDGVDSRLLKDQIVSLKVGIEYHAVPDQEFKLMDTFKVTSVPVTILIDKIGIVRYLHENYDPGDEKKIEEEVSRLLKETIAPVL